MIRHCLPLKLLLLGILDAHSKDYKEICYISDQDMTPYPKKYSIYLERAGYDQDKREYAMGKNCSYLDL